MELPIVIPGKDSLTEESKISSQEEDLETKLMRLLSLASSKKETSEDTKKNDGAIENNDKTDK